MWSPLAMLKQDKKNVKTDNKSKQSHFVSKTHFKLKFESFAPMV